MDAKDKAMERAAALLRKANGTEFEHERDSFIAKAHELMERHHLTEKDLPGEQGRFSSIARLLNHPEAVSLKLGILQTVIGEAFGCFAYQLMQPDRCTFVFHGRAVIVEKAAQLWDTLGSDMLARAATAKPSAQPVWAFSGSMIAITSDPCCGGTTERDAERHRLGFMDGYIQAVHERLAALNRAADDNSGGALLPALLSDVSEARAEVEDMYDAEIRERMPEGGSRAGRLAGMMAGANADLLGERLTDRSGDTTLREIGA